MLKAINKQKEKSDYQKGMRNQVDIRLPSATWDARKQGALHVAKGK